MKLFLIIAGVLVAVVLLAGFAAFFAGLFIPENHKAQVTAELNADRDTVWSIITDYPNLPTWWGQVKSIEKQVKNGREIWINTDKNGQKVSFYTSEEVKPSKLVRTIVSDGLPFGGSWTFELEAVQGKTRLTLTEEGFIKPPIVRTMAKMFMDEKATMRDFMDSLQKKLGN